MIIHVSLYCSFADDTRKSSLLKQKCEDEMIPSAEDMKNILIFFLKCHLNWMFIFLKCLLNYIVSIPLNAGRFLIKMQFNFL